MFLYIIEWVVIVLGFFFLLTQFIVPWIMKTPVLPYFRKEEKRTSQLSEAEEALRIKRLEDQILNLYQKGDHRDNSKTSK